MSPEIFSTDFISFSGPKPSAFSILQIEFADLELSKFAMQNCDRHRKIVYVFIKYLVMMMISTEFAQSKAVNSIRSKVHTLSQSQNANFA